MAQGGIKKSVNNALGRHKDTKVLTIYLLLINLIIQHKYYINSY